MPYFLPEGYIQRLDNEFFDDIHFKDRYPDEPEYQMEVYQIARTIYDKYSCKSVADIGCGSAEKLLRLFGDADTLGVDVGDTVPALMEKYPNRRWESCEIYDFFAPPQADLVICADTLEHIPDPDDMMSLIKEFCPQVIVFSTPDRSLRADQSSPPRNRSHCREWSFQEFRAYVGEWFTVDGHLITNRAQLTQCIIARPKVS